MPKCPNCGKFYINTPDICQKCGFDFVAQREQKQEEKNRQEQEAQQIREEEIRLRQEYEEYIRKINPEYEYKTVIVDDVMGMFPKEEFDKKVSFYSQRGWRLNFIFTNELNKTALGDTRQRTILVFERCIKPVEDPDDQPMRHAK